jgi:hypothetical protein
MTQTAHPCNEAEAEQQPSAAELKARILTGDLDIQLIEDYNLFRDLGGIPNEVIRERLRLAIENLKARQNSSYVPPPHPPAPPSSPHPPYSNAAAQPITTPTQTGVGELFTQNKEIGVAIISAAASIAESYWQAKVAREQAEATRASVALAKAEAVVERDREAAVRAGERRDQLYIWALTAAVKLATGYATGGKNMPEGGE